MVKTMRLDICLRLRSGRWGSGLTIILMTRFLKSCIKSVITLRLYIRKQIQYYHDTIFCLLGYGCIYPHTDKEGRTIIWCVVRHYHKSVLTPMIREFTVYLLELAELYSNRKGWILIIDINRAGLSNVDLAYCYFTLRILERNCPRGPRYFIAIDLPWILNTTAKLIMSFMNKEFRTITKFMKKDELSEYIDRKYISIQLNGLYDKDFNYVPIDAKPLEE